MIEKQFNIAIDPDLETTSDGATQGAPHSVPAKLSGQVRFWCPGFPHTSPSMRTKW